MTEEVIKEVTASISAPSALKNEDQLMNSSDIIDDNSVPPDLKRKEKPVPHYLRASTRSCHDNCKYGTHHSPELKKHLHVRRAKLRRASTGNQETNRVEIILPQRARPRKDQKLENSHVKAGNATAASSSKALQEIVPDTSESTLCVEDLPAEASDPGNLPADAECVVVSRDDVADFGDGESSDGAESIELEMPLAIQDSDASDENMEDGILASENMPKDGAKPLVDPVTDQTVNDHARSEVRTTLNVMTATKDEQVGPGNKSKISDDEPTKPKAKAALSRNRNSASSQKSRRISHLKAAVADVEITSEPKPVRTRANASVTTTTKFSSQKKTSPIVTAAPKIKEIKAPLQSNATDSVSKPARLAKLKVSMMKNARSPSLSSEKQTNKKMTLKNVVKNSEVLQKQEEEKVTPRQLKLSRSMNKPAKSISIVKVRTIKKERIAPSVKNSKKVSGTENSAADAKNAKEKSLKSASLKVRKPEVNGKESQPRKEKPDTPRTRIPKVPKHASIPSTTATQPPRKLTFRRGKVLDPDDGSSSTPTRRLRFRPAMAATDATVRSRGGRVSGKGNGRGASGAREAGTSRAEVVVLRRRQGGVSGDKKKQEQVLLNNVIEETASRLVTEARKSKVKALVGAFETVISLQEGGNAGKAATTTVA